MKTKVKTKSTFKPERLAYEWNESPASVINDLEPVLSKQGLFLLEDPLSIGSDSYGYILVNNRDMTISDYKKLLSKEYGDNQEWINELMIDNKLKDSDKLTKFIKYMN